MSVQQFEREVLNAHNKYRAMHGAQPLKLCPKLNKLATEWAKHLLAINTMQHRQNNPYGENIYWAYGRNLEGADAVRSWYEEISQYQWHSPSFQYKTAHFTQLVWKGSTELGVGFAKRGDTIYVVCNYNPPGNYNNKYRENVAPRRHRSPSK